MNAFGGLLKKQWDDDDSQKSLPKSKDWIRVIGTVYTSEELTQKGMSLIRAVWREISFCQHAMLSILHLQQAV